MDFRRRLFDLRLPLPVYTTAFPPSYRANDALLFFRPGVKYRGPWDDAVQGTPGDPVPVEIEQPPLKPWEWACYLVFGFMVSCTFLALAIIIWLGHTPIFAN